MRRCHYAEPAPLSAYDHGRFQGTCSCFLINTPVSVSLRQASLLPQVAQPATQTDRKRDWHSLIVAGTVDSTVRYTELYKKVEELAGCDTERCAVLLLTTVDETRSWEEQVSRAPLGELDMR